MQPGHPEIPVFHSQPLQFDIHRPEDHRDRSVRTRSSSLRLFSSVSRSVPWIEPAFCRTRENPDRLGIVTLGGFEVGGPGRPVRTAAGEQGVGVRPARQRQAERDAQFDVGRILLLQLPAHRHRASVIDQRRFARPDLRLRRSRDGCSRTPARASASRWPDPLPPAPGECRARAETRGPRRRCARWRRAFRQSSTG